MPLPVSAGCLLSSLSSRASSPLGAAYPVSLTPDIWHLIPFLQEVLDQIRPLNREQFTTLVTNFMLGLRGKFKVPTFAHTELDLHKVRGIFWLLGY